MLSSWMKPVSKKDGRDLPTVISCDVLNDVCNDGPNGKFLKYHKEHPFHENATVHVPHVSINGQVPGGNKMNKESMKKIMIYHMKNVSVMICIRIAIKKLLQHQ